MINHFANIFGKTRCVKIGQENKAGALTKQSNKHLTLITAGALAFHVYASQGPSIAHADFPPVLQLQFSVISPGVSGASEKCSCPSLAATSAGAGDHRRVMCCPLRYEYSAVLSFQPPTRAATCEHWMTRDKKSLAGAKP